MILYLNLHTIKNPKKILTIKEIAAKAKVSPGTVDRVIHKRGDVSPENIKKVNSIIKKLGYKPNIFARNLVLNKQFNFALFIPDFKKQEYWKATVKGADKAQKELATFGVTVTRYFFDPYNPASFKKQAQKLIADHPDGISVAPAFHNEFQEFVNECKSKKIPFIFIDSTISENKPLSFIGQDAHASGYMAARLMTYNATQGNYLILANTRKIDNHYHFSERIRGFKDFFKENLSEKNTIIELEGIEELDLTSELDTFFSKQKVLGIFVPNSRVHYVAAYLELKKMKGIHLIGYDLIEKNCEYLKNGTIDFLINQKPEEQGYKSIHLLHNSILLKQPVKPVNLMPLNIVVKENIFMN